MIVALLLAASFSLPAFALDAGDITVASLKGEVQVTMHGAARKVRVGSVLELPATVRTGRDGAIELRQGATSIAVGPDTLLEFPALEKAGAPIDRVLQPSGNAFYDIGKREGRKLRVETPYLVGVVKGTQFNVAAQDESTTISLFEGLLEVRAADGSAVVDLKAGEIASRRRGDTQISVLKMDAGKAPTPGARPRANAGDPGGTPLALYPGSGTEEHGAQASLLDPGAPRPDVAGVATSLDVRSPAAGVSVESVEVRTPVAAVDIETGVDSGAGTVAVNAGANIGVGTAVDLGANVDVNLGAGAQIDAGATVSVGNTVDADVGVSVGLGGNGASVDVSANIGADAGLATVGASTGVEIEVAPTQVSIEADVGAQVGAGPIVADVNTLTGVDLGTSGLSVEAGAGATVDTGALGAGVRADAAIDVGTDSIGATVDAGAALGNVAPAIDAGLSTNVDVSTGTVDLGVSVGGLDLNVGLDLGLGGNEDATDTDSSTTDTATDTGNTGTVDVGGLLDGLLRRPGRK